MSFSSIAMFLVLVSCLLGGEVLKNKKTLILGCIRTIVAPVLVAVFGVTLGHIVNSDVMLGMWIALLTSAGIRIDLLQNVKLSLEDFSSYFLKIFLFRAL